MSTSVPSVEEFRAEARSWLAAHMPRRAIAPTGLSRAEAVARARVLQARLFDGGFAGVAFPAEYGGRGLGPAHQQVWTEESADYEMPAVLGVPSIGVLGATLLECGSEDQRARHLPAILRGDEVWVQLLSEPTGGSDLAGARLTAQRDGDRWLLRGSKTWTSGANLADWGLCLARTNWDVPKHRGLTMFCVPLDHDRLDIREIRLANGTHDFCEEFFDDVDLPLDAVVGDVDGGWAVASTLLVHERDTVGGKSPYARPSDGGHRDDPDARTVAEVARRVGRLDDVAVLDDLGRLRVLELVQTAFVDRVTTAVLEAELPPVAGAYLKLFSATLGTVRDDVTLRIAGSRAVVGGDAEDLEIGLQFLVRQAMCLAGGSNEMQRNLIAERVLGMPRDPSGDRDRPFRETLGR